MKIYPIYIAVTEDLFENQFQIARENDSKLEFFQDGSWQVFGEGSLETLQKRAIDGTFHFMGFGNETLSQLFFWNEYPSLWQPFTISPSIRQYFSSVYHLYVWHKASVLEPKYAPLIAVAHDFRQLKKYEEEIDDIWRNKPKSEITEDKKISKTLIIKVCLQMRLEQDHLLRKFHEVTNCKFIASSLFDKELSIGLPTDSPLVLNRKKWRGKNVLGNLINQFYESKEKALA